MSCAARSERWGPMGYGPPFWAWHPGWIILMILGFIFWWPVGLAILAYTLWGRRMACWGGRGYDHWQAKMERMRDKMERFGHGGWGPSSGNRAFDEYRAETLRRLEEEQREFREFLQRLRMAKDKAEFDQFMAERRNRAESPPPPPPQQV
jgi:Protein of unknown function (DUF2852)